MEAKPQKVKKAILGKGLLKVCEVLNPTVPRTPIPHLLNSNNQATEEEHISIANSVALAEQRREVLIKREPGLLDNKTLTWSQSRTLHKIALLDNFIQKHNDCISPSPILSLPIELLQQIFRDVTDSLAAKKFDGHIDPFEFFQRGYRKKVHISHLPWSISHVCRKWRVVGLSTPYLWQSLPVVDLSDARWSRPRFMSLLKELFRRSQGIPTEMIVRIGPISKVYHPVLNLIMERSNRCGILRIIVDGSNVARGMEAIHSMLTINSNFPSLRIVAISAPYGRSLRVPPNLTAIVAPFLEEVVLCNTSPAIFLLSSSPGLKQLTFTGIDTVSELERSIQFILVSSATLTNLCFKTTLSGHLSSGTLFLPNLVKLEFDSHWRQSNWFLDHLVVPSLNSLALTTEEDEDACVVARNMIHRSDASNINELSISQHNRYPIGLCSLLSATPFLLYLNLILPRTEDILELSKSRNGDLILVPSLRTCIFTPMNLISSDERQALSIMASKRFPPSTQLPSNPTSIGDAVDLHPKKLVLNYTWVAESGMNAAQCALHGWSKTEIYENIEIEHGCLQRILFKPILLFPSSRPKFDRKLEKEMRTILRRLLDKKIDNIGDILESNIHRTLVKISHIHITGNKRWYRCSELADEILKNWLPICQKSLRDLRWQSTGNNSLQYMSDGNIRINRNLRYAPHLQKWETSEWIVFL